jgi:hypothetical protein
MIDLTAGLERGVADKRSRDAFLWERGPYRLWSLWEMAEHIVSALIGLVRVMTQVQTIARQNSTIEQIDPSVLENSRLVFEQISKTHHMASVFPIVTPHLARLAEVMSSPTTSTELLQGISELQHRLDDDVKTHVYLLVTKTEYYGQEKLFGDLVFDNFSSANEDIFEAGMCLAVGRSTGCVMHLMRVVEVALSVLADELNVPKQNDWGAYLRKIETELDNRVKMSGARSPDEQFYAEAAVNFDRMRRAWRNPTMHPDKTYSPERAEEILSSIKSFMAHLAIKLHE